MQDRDDSLLLTNGYVVTVDEDRRVFENGWVAIEGESIVALGPREELGERRAQKTVDLGGKLVMPGLINGHNHHWGSLFKNTGEGYLLEEWLDKVTIPLMRALDNQDFRVAAYLGAIEQIRTGTTCSLNHAVNINDEESMAAMIEPVLDVGIRQMVTKELRDTPSPRFSDSYPARDHIRTRDEELALAEQIVERWDGRDGIIHMGLVIEAGENWMLHNTTSDEIILEGLELARRRNLKVTNHCSSGTAWLSSQEFKQLTGGGDIDYLARIGALVDNWVFVHALHLKQREIDHIARCGAAVVTNPVSTAYTCSGIAPLKQMFEAGVTIGLGSDGSYVNCSMDMVEQMKFTALLQNLTHFDPHLVTAERAIEMATIGSAKAMGIDHLVGSLEVGKRADIAVFDLDHAHSTVGNRPVGALVFSAHGTDVDMVIVNGRQLLADGQLVGFDAEQEVLAEARERATQAIERAGLGERVFVPWRKS